MARKSAKKVQKRATTTTRKRVSLDEYFGGLPLHKVESYSQVLLRTIKRELSDAASFTREDLLHLNVFNGVSTITRYEMNRRLLRHLIDRTGDLVEVNRTNVCLKGSERLWNETPLHKLHYEAICGIIARMPNRSTIMLMDIVDLWQTDPHLTINNKRVAVRRALTRLVKDGLLTRKDDFQFIVRS